MQLSLFNLTDNILCCTPITSRDGIHYTVLPNTSLVVPEVTCTHHFILSTWDASIRSESTLAVDEKRLSRWRELPKKFSVTLRRATGHSLQTLEVAEDCPWRIYRHRVSRRRCRIMVFPKRDMASFLADMPDSLSLSSACLPGTHDTMAFYGWPVSQCQSVNTPLSIQLNSGIRILDIRLAVVRGQLISYHGQYPQRAPFESILADLHDFLSSPTSCRETVVVSVKQEDYDRHSPKVFSLLVRKEIEESPGGLGMWFLENRIPTLGEVRGKAIMFSRFGGDGEGWEGRLEGMGIHPTNWPDSEKGIFTWMCKDTLVQTQDWYHIPSFLSIPEKAELSTDLLVPPTDASSSPVLSITYFSASSFPFATPTVVSTGFGWPSFGFGVEGVNSRVARFLLDSIAHAVDNRAHNMHDKSPSGTITSGPQIRGWTFMDFFDEPVGNGLVPLLVECNFRGHGDEVKAA